jgi:tetratricopeptide (TPR) repeat protein
VNEAGPAGAAPAPAPTLLVVHVTSALDPPSRDAIYRTRQPCDALGGLEHVAVVSGSLRSPALTASGLLDAADVLVLSDVADPDLLPVIDARRRARRLTVYEVNGHLLSPPPGAPTEARARDILTRSLPLHLARHADALQFATPALETRFAFLGERRAVFPSQRAEAPPASFAPRRPDRVVLGWGGGRAHADDLSAVAPALARVLARHPEVDLALMGDERLREVWGGLPPGRLSVRPPGGHAEYERFLDDLDVGLAPLQPTDFNRCRSDVRFLEYAAHGVLAVCADLEPYRDAVRGGETGFLFRDGLELETVLDRILAEPERRAAVVARAARAVAEERLERPHAGARLAFYLATASQAGCPLAPGPAPPAFDALAGERTPGARHVALDGEVERRLAAGLEARRAGDLGEARRLFTEAGRLAPGAYLPALLLGETEEDPALSIEALARAAELNPRSCLAPHLLGLRLGLAGAPDEAAAWFERARAVAPSYGAPQERLGERAEAAGRLADAATLYEEAALANAAFALPVIRLAAAATRGGRVDKAVALLARSLAADPELWLTNLALGSAYVAQRRFHEARVHLERALDGAEDRAAVLAELARAEIGLGNLEAARAARRRPVERPPAGLKDAGTPSRAASPRGGPRPRTRRLALPGGRAFLLRSGPWRRAPRSSDRRFRSRRCSPSVSGC